MSLSPEYLAGFFDGEGSIEITLPCKKTQYAVRVVIVQCRAEVLNSIKAQFGGNLYLVPRKSGHQQATRWTLSSKLAEDFLRVIEPYVIVKRPQVELALKLRETMTTLPRGKLVNDLDRQRAKREAEMAHRHGFYLEMRRLNKRGA